MKAFKINFGKCRPITRVPQLPVGFLSLLALVVSGCFGDRHPTASGASFRDEAFRTLGAKPAAVLDTNHAAVLDGDTLNLVRFHAGTGMPPDQVVALGWAAAGDAPGSEVVYDRMEWESFNPGDTLPCALLRIPLPSAEFKRLQITLPALDGNRTADTLRFTVDRHSLVAHGVQRCEGPVSGAYQRLNQWVFRQQLTHGVFMEVQHGFYLLFYERTCWVIRRNPGDGSNKFMLHFIDQDSAFDNFSFPIGRSAFEGCMEDPAGFWITRINLERPFDSYRKIRVGQFTGAGNIWTQTLQVSRILENELLRYTDELDQRH